MLTIIADALMVASRQKHASHDERRHDQHMLHKARRDARRAHHVPERLNRHRDLW